MAAALISVPLSALSLTAQRVVAYSGSGQGGYEHPFLITTCLELQNMLEDASDNNGLFWLANDINCTDSISWNTSKGFDPIKNFQGTFDGRGYKIIGLHINRPDEDNVGLFSELNDCLGGI